MASKEVVILRRSNTVMLVALEKLALCKDPATSSIALQALKQVKRLQA